MTFEKLPMDIILLILDVYVSIVYYEYKNLNKKLLAITPDTANKVAPFISKYVLNRIRMKRYRSLTQFYKTVFIFDIKYLDGNKFNSFREWNEKNDLKFDIQEHIKEVSMTKVSVFMRVMTKSLGIESFCINFLTLGYSWYINIGYVFDFDSFRKVLDKFHFNSECSHNTSCGSIYYTERTRKATFPVPCGAQITNSIIDHYEAVCKEPTLSFRTICFKSYCIACIEKINERKKLLEL